LPCELDLRPAFALLGCQSKPVGRLNRILDDPDTMAKAACEVTLPLRIAQFGSLAVQSRREFRVLAHALTGLAADPEHDFGDRIGCG
jgi:hypothetical protein